MIKLHNLSKTYGQGPSAVKAINGIELTIGSGMFGLLGPNGAGKTTLMRIMAGVINPTSGKLEVNGQEIRSEKSKKTLKAILGYLPQELGIYPDLSAAQFVDYMAILKGLDNPHMRRERVAEVLEMVGLSDVANRKLKGFSGGMKRRVGIAQALVNKPHLLIVDEPTAGLDPEERIRFRNLLVNLASERVVILSTHIVEDISQTCRDMAVLSKGQILFRGSPSELIQSAEGHIWTVKTGNGSKPNHDLTVVSMLHQVDGIQYRLVGDNIRDFPGAEATTPGLEDGYVWLMKNKGVEKTTLSAK